MKKSILKQVIIEQKKFLKTAGEYVQRELISEIHEINKLPGVVVITGPRRAGKSVFLLQIIDKYYSTEDVYYLNLDDERLISLKLEDMQTVIETFIELFGKKKIIFLDEIQNLNGWERFVSRLYREGYKVYITGSNAKLLSSELSTFLTGRHVDIEIYPFSFREFLLFRGFKINNKEEYYQTEKKVEIKKLLDEYLKNGGFPEMVKYLDTKLLKNLFIDVVEKDVVNRYSIKEARTLKEIAYFLISNASKEFSYNKLKNTYFLGSVHTIKNYISYLASTYLFFEVPRFSYSLKEMHTKIKKIYIIDTGLINAMSFSSTQDIGRLYENLVFIELKRRKKEVYYYKDKRGREVDFITKKDKKIIQCIQVCVDLSYKKTYAREINNILKCMEEFELKDGLIITEDMEDEVKIKNKNIKFIPLWKWGLEG